VNLASNSHEATVAVGHAPGKVCVSRDNRHVYVVTGGDNSLSVIDTETNLVNAIALPGAEGLSGLISGGAAVTPDNKTIYVTDNRSGRVFAVDGETNQIRATLTISNPVDVVIVP
jgi:YVTN family beta-propeller protein